MGFHKLEHMMAKFFALRNLSWNPDQEVAFMFG